MKATSSAIHLISRHGPWGFQPLFHAIMVSYALLMPLSGSRTIGPASSLIPGSEAGYMHPCILSLAPSPISLMQTVAIATDTPCSVFLLITHLHNPAFVSPISSSLAELYFLILIIISLFPLLHTFWNLCPSIPII